jgi:multiple antibiotic resistance protein
MSSLLYFAVVSFGSLFSIVDPFAALPVFLALAGAQPRPALNRTALRASATCFVVLATFALAGNYIFSFFGITLPAFKIAGGILLFGVGLEMMRARKSDTRSTHEEEQDAETKEDVGLIPLGLPLLSGPGAIAAVMVLVGKAPGLPERMTLLGVVVAVSFLTFLILRSAAMMLRVLGKTGVNVIGRVMGLILSAVAMQFVLDGLHEAFPSVLGK